MLDEEWLAHGPASLNLLLDRQAENQKLPNYRAGIIAAMWAKDATPGSFFPDLKKDEDRQKRQEKREYIKATIANAKRKRKLGDKGTSGAGKPAEEPSR